MTAATQTSSTDATRSDVDLSLVKVGDIQGTFIVPAYQRGYRWGREQVEALLDDIVAVDGRKYCLQPIVVKRAGDAFELIDGQQRLTTLHLVFRYFEKEGFKKAGPSYSIEYATRTQSAAFLRDPDVYEGDNIDFFHMRQAYACIREWFAKHEHRTQRVVDKIYGNLYDWVNVIWYLAPDVDSATLFRRLNVGRIPLTNAELIKALLLSRTRRDIDDDRRPFEIATQWDGIERELRNDDFWAFLTSGRSDDDYPARIELLFELIANKAHAPDRFHTFFHFKDRLDKGVSVAEIWESVLNQYEVLRAWYHDRDLYHWIGYLVAVAGARHKPLAELVAASREQTKSAFKKGLHARIRDRLNLTREDLDEIDYEKAPTKCGRALLLFNVESTRRLEHSSERYPFRPHKNQQWSLEHIHAQGAEQLTRKEQWQQWLDEHRAALLGLNVPPTGLSNRDALVADIDAGRADVTKESFADLAARITTFFNDLDSDDGVHGLDNLALLPTDTNAALSNFVFEVKRRRILDRDRDGHYIPICTRRVFLKYYTPSGNHQLHFWSRQDRKAYRAAIHEVLAPYLKPKHEEVRP